MGVGTGRCFCGMSWQVHTSRALTGHTSQVALVSPLVRMDRLLASGSYDTTIRLWDAVTGEHKRTLTGHTNRVDSVAFSPDGRTVASGGYDATIRLWDAVTGEHKGTLIGHAWLRSIAFSPDGRTRSPVDSTDGTIRLWDTMTGAPKQTFTGYTRMVRRYCV